MVSTRLVKFCAVIGNRNSVAGFFRAALALLLLLAYWCLISIPYSFADTEIHPAPIPGWTHTEDFDHDTDEKHGIPLSGYDVQYSSPAIAEIDGDTSNGKEVAVGGADSVLYTYKSDGTLLWSVDLPNASCTKTSKTNRLFSSPAVGELFGDGVPYVVIGYGGLGAKLCDGGVAAYRGSDGTRLWNFSLQKFSKSQGISENSYGVFGSPALADTDGDGQLEIGFGAFNRLVYLLEADGTNRWYYQAADTVWSSPAFVNVDSDPDLEMIIGTDISRNIFLRPKTKNGGFVYAFKTNLKGKQTFRNKASYVWQTYLPQVIFSSPSVADVLPDNPGNEIVVQSGCFFPEGTNKKDGKWVKILSAKTGKVLRTLDTQACSPSSPAIGDIDDDGLLEVVVTVNGSKSIGGSGKSTIMAFKPATNTLLWSIIPTDHGRNDPFGGNFLSPTIADLDGNGSLEVIAANFNAVHIYRGVDGTALTCEERECEDGALTLPAFDNLKSTPAIGDINGDGELDLVVAGGHTDYRGHGFLYGWTGFTDILGSDSGDQTPYSTPWPMYRANPQHTALYEDVD